MPQDFRVGLDIGIYGRCIRVYDCDEYTRQFFTVSIFLQKLLMVQCTLTNCPSRIQSGCISRDFSFVLPLSHVFSFSLDERNETEEICVRASYI